MKIVEELWEKSSKIFKSVLYILIATGLSFMIPEVKAFFCPAQVFHRCTSCSEAGDLDDVIQEEDKKSLLKEENVINIEEKIIKVEENIIVEEDLEKDEKLSDLYDFIEKNEAKEEQIAVLTAFNTTLNPAILSPEVSDQLTEKKSPTKWLDIAQGDFSSCKRESSFTAVRSCTQNMVEWIFPFLKK